MFNYDKSRGGAVAERLLENFQGRYVQTDGYSGYDKPCAAKGLVHLGCMDHARRKVVEAIKTQGKPVNAINYMINQWDHLVRYCEHGQLRIRNILA